MGAEVRKIPTTVAVVAAMAIAVGGRARSISPICSRPVLNRRRRTRTRPLTNRRTPPCHHRAGDGDWSTGRSPRTTSSPSGAAAGEETEEAAEEAEEAEKAEEVEMGRRGKRGKRGNGRMGWMKKGGEATAPRYTTNEISSGEEVEETQEGRTTHIITVSYFSTAPSKCPRSWNCLLFPPQILIPPAERAAAAAAVMAMAAELAVQLCIAGRKEQRRRRRIQKAKDAKRRFGCRMCRTRCGGKRACTCTVVRDNCGGGCVVECAAIECATECATEYVRRIVVLDITQPDTHTHHLSFFLPSFLPSFLPPFVPSFFLQVVTLREMLPRAKGTTIVAGLGLGWLLSRVCNKAEVHTVILVDKSRELAEWIVPLLRSAGHLDGCRLEVRRGMGCRDVQMYRCGSRELES